MPEIEALCWEIWRRPECLNSSTKEILEDYLNRRRVREKPEAANPPEDLPQAETLPVITEVIRELDSGRFNFDEEAARKWGKSLRPAAKSIAAYLCDERPFIRQRARIALIHSEGVTAEIVPAVIRAIQQRKDAAKAMELLAKIGSPASAAVPVLAGFIATGLAPEREAATAAILAIGVVTAECLPALTKALSKKLSQESALRVVALMGPAASSTVAAAARCLKADYPPIRLAACKALEAIGPAAAGARPELQGLSGDADERVRQAASRTLAATGGHGR